MIYEPSVQLQEQEEKKQNYRKLNSLSQTGQIIFAGSSLMEQFPVETFVQDFNIISTVYNRGISGATTADYNDFLLESVSSLKPSRIFLNIGSNDLDRENFSMELHRKTIGKLVDDIRKIVPDILIFFLAYFPVREDIRATNLQPGVKQRTNSIVNESNTMLSALCASKNVTFIDVNFLLRDESGSLKKEYASDHMHILSHAYQIIFEHLLPYIV